MPDRPTLPVPRPWPPAVLVALRHPVRRAVAGLRGHVLDLGHALDHTGELERVPADVESVTVLDGLAADRLRRRLEPVDVPVEVRVATLGELDPGAMRYDSVLSVFELPFLPDLPLALRAVTGLLADGGELLAVEPVGRWGLRHRMLGAPAALLRGTAGLHLDRDVPSAVRDVGLAVTTVERMTMPTLVWPLRHVVRIGARRASDFEPAPEVAS